MNKYKITIWTSGWRSKCIYKGEVEILPRIGDQIVFNNNAGLETVEKVAINLLNNEIEITIKNSDTNGYYTDIF